MPNHFHFLVGVRSEEALRKTFPKFETLEKFVPKRFSNFFSSYTQSFNKVYERKGSLFIKNFKRKPIQTEPQWQETFLYIHLNPVKHGFADSINDWRWSSWHAYKHMEKKSLLERSYYMNFFDGMSHVNDVMEVKREMILNKDLE
jgi:REP element-mobilizing transposase RayT